MQKTALIAFGMLLAAVVLALCSCTQQAEPEYAGAIAENMLQAMNNENYALYSEHFDEAMKNAMPEAVFKQSIIAIRGKIGSYISKQFVTTQQSGQYISVFYKAKFSGEPGDVTVKVVFQEIDGKPRVSGFWMDSPNLRK